jgi:hypothetical protein
MFVWTFLSLLKFCALSGLTVGTDCGQEKQPRKAAPDASSALSSGAEPYQNHCIVCHGNNSKGSGPFPPPYGVPSDLKTLSRRHAGKFPEYYVLQGAAQWCAPASTRTCRDARLGNGIRSDEPIRQDSGRIAD